MSTVPKPHGEFSRPRTPTVNRWVSVMGRALGRLRFTFRTSGVEPVLRLSLVLLVASLEAGLGTVTDRLRRPALR